MAAPFEHVHFPVPSVVDIRYILNSITTCLVSGSTTLQSSNVVCQARYGYHHGCTGFDVSITVLPQEKQTPRSCFKDISNLKEGNAAGIRRRVYLSAKVEALIQRVWIGMLAMRAIYANRARPRL